jgi:ABC-type sugar transport system ATPase subunit
LERKVVLEVKDLCKYFGGIKAIHNVELKLFEKEIIAIVGDNGAGKSTFIKVISGVYKKNSGDIYLNSEKVEINSPMDAKKLGIETVYQDQGVVPLFTATENLFLAREKTKKNFLGKAFKFMDFNFMKNETIKLLERMRVELKDIDAPVINLSGGQRQSVVVGKAVYWGGNILIFDEPTNNLGAKQERNIIEVIKRIREEYNVAIIIISHNISHVFELVDRIIILRNGIKVGEKVKTETNPNEIVSLITGVI